MSDHASPITTSKIGGSGTARADVSQLKGRRRSMGRALCKPALAALVAAGGLALTTVGGATAYADTLTNGPTIMLGNYPILGTAPAYVSGAGVLPASPGAPGNAATIFMTGSAGYGTDNDTYAIGIPGGSPNWGTQLSTAPYTGAAAPQTWYFQQVGYVGLITEAAGPDGPQLAAVYRIVNYDNGTYTCLEGYGNDPTAGSIVDSYGCNPNQINQTNQLWVVGSPGQSARVFSPGGGSLVPNEGVGQIFSNYLLGDTYS
ncbi:MAG TPA: hypothetical protein VMF65_09640, partial [Acidimicrobiales bacterium]|nr:hypothetical protein [Acidimicrobiales bacterium]